MTDTVIEEKGSALIESRDALKKIFKWENEQILLTGAAYFVSRGQMPDAERLLACQEILKEHAGFLSEFKGELKVPVLCHMALAEDPENYLLMLISVTKQLKVLKWVSESYRILAAMTLCDHHDAGDEEALVQRTKEIFERMKEKHHFLTGDEDVPFAAMLAAADPDTDSLVRVMEACFERLKPVFKDGDARQSLSHVMCTDLTGWQDSCDRVMDIWQELKDRGHKYGSGKEIVMLGAFGSMEKPVDEIADAIICADQFLKRQKGFGFMGVSDAVRKMYAAFLVLDCCGSAGEQISGLAVSALIEIQMEICLIIMTTTMVTVTSVS